MEPNLTPLEPPKPPQPTKPMSKKGLIGVFITAFIILLAILNLPTLVKAITYPFIHSEEEDNQLLTQQYRDIYGYEKHPEFMAAAEAATRVTPSVFPIAAPAPAAAQMTISIPKINVSAPVLEVSDTNDATLLGALKNGTVLYPGSSNPGQPGSTVILGHSSSTFPWTKYSAIFSLLDKLQPNDLIYVSVNGVEHIYRVQAVHKGSAQQLLDSGLAGDLIVATCWPIGTDSNRMAVSATLVQ